MAPLTCPVCAAPVRQGDLICINCGANLARRDAPPAPQQPAGPYQSQDQGQAPYPQQQYGAPQQDQQPYGAPGQQYPPQQDYQQQYPPQQGQSPYQQDQQSPYGAPQDQQPYGGPPQHDQQQPYGMPGQQEQYGAPQQQYPQQQGYASGYGAPSAPHVPPPPREPTMTGGESTAAFTPFCPHCGADIPDIGNPVCVQCLRPLHDQAGGPGPQQLTVFIQFSSGEVQVSAGQELILGRDPVQSPVASTFSRFDNVSRRHATVGVDGAGQVWVRDERSTNGTFVNDRRLQPGEQAPLREGDSVRLAADARGQVRFGR